MCKALFIQNEKADRINRIPLTPSNQFSFPAYTHLKICTPTIYRDILPTMYILHEAISNP